MSRSARSMPLRAMEMSLSLLALWHGQPDGRLFVTHSISEAVLLADRVVVMSPRPGRVAEIVDVDLPRPRSLTRKQAQNFHRARTNPGPNI